MTETPHAAAAAIAGRLTAAWNAGDCHAFVAPFAPDADFINIFGLHLRGRQPIADQHAFIFRGVYLGSRAHFEVVDARALTPEVIHAVLSSRVAVPAGPMAGTVATIMNLVLVHAAGAWHIAAFHNTRIAPPPEH